MRAGDDGDGADGGGRVLPADLTRYFDAVVRGSRREAIGVALDLLDRGVAPEDVITLLLAEAQREIGQGWQEGRWGVAMEHRASAIAESAVQAVTDTALRAPNAPAEGSRGRAVVACTEGEWHMLPGRMACEVLRLRGVDVSFIGPSVPAGELASMLGDDPPAAVALSCSMPQSLAGSWRSINALRALGMTIVCGGRGFGPDGAWGLALGADLWAPDFDTGATLLLSALAEPRRHPRPPVGTPEVIEEMRLVRLDHDAYVQEASAVALGRWRFLRDSDDVIRGTREDLSTTLSLVASAALVDDRAVVDEYTEWFETLLAAHGRPINFTATMYALLLDVLPARLPLVRAMARSGLEGCTDPPMT